VTVVDNGSDVDDWMALSEGLRKENVQLIRLDTNIGFAAGHNVVIREAMKDDVEYVWLLNNDTWIPEGTVSKLVRFMDDDRKCGAASPLIHALHDSSVIDFCGVCHDWKNLRKIIPAGVSESRRLEKSNPEDMGLYGTALMLRTAALKHAGLLNEDYFAYYEDDDISKRISHAGWKNRMCFDATISHRRTSDSFAERPDYYFYLMSRNELFFWGECGNGRFQKKMIRLRLVSRSLIRASRLRSRGMLKKSEACLLGIQHGLTKRGGAPKFDAAAPGWMVFISRYVPRVLLKCLA
jgi:GT2 family glycosyltransferase